MILIVFDVFEASLETEDNDFVLFGEYLYYLHLMLKTYCNGLRVFKNVISWHSSSKSFVFTVGCFLIGTILLLLPLGTIFLYTIRILVWTLFGPWMKLFDFHHMQHRYGRIHQDNDEIKEIKPINVDSFFESPEMKKLAKMVRVAAEDALKLKVMRQHLYGNFSEIIPSVDTSRFPSLPLQTSTAMSLEMHKKVAGYDCTKQSEIVNLPGQRLQGKMIHVRSNDFFHDDDQFSVGDDDNISIESSDSYTKLMR